MAEDCVTKLILISSVFHTIINNYSQYIINYFDNFEHIGIILLYIKVYISAWHNKCSVYVFIYAVFSVVNFTKFNRFDLFCCS